jgi:hypothetical protein
LPKLCRMRRRPFRIVPSYLMRLILGESVRQWVENVSLLLSGQLQNLSVGNEKGNLPRHFDLAGISVLPTAWIFLEWVILRISTRLNVFFVCSTPKNKIHP